MTRPTTVIGRLRIELALHTCDTRASMLLPERVSRLFAGALAQVLADELALVQPGRLERLELVLPPLTLDCLERELPQHLRQALQRALGGLATTRPGSAAANRHAARPLAGLEHFLLHGWLPWQQPAFDFTPDAAVRMAVRQHPGSLREALHRLAPLAAPSQRLAQQLAPATLAALLVFLAPAAGKRVVAYIQGVLAAHRRAALVAGSEAALGAVLWRFALGEVLTRRASSQAYPSFIEGQLRQLATHYQQSYGELGRWLAATLPPPTTLPEQELATALRSLVLPAAATEHLRLPSFEFVPTLAREEPSYPPEPAAYAALVYYVRHQSLPPGAAGTTQALLAAALRAVVHQSAEALRQLARQAGALATAGALVRHLSGGWWVRALRALAPAAEVTALLHLLAPPAAMYPREGRTERRGTWRARSLAGLATYPARWQRALHYLLLRPGATSGELRYWLAAPPVPASLPSASPRSADAAPGALPQLVVFPGISPPAAALSALSATSHLFAYLLAGPAGTSDAPQREAGWRREAEWAVEQAPATLHLFLQHAAATHPVLRHLAALIDFATLRRLVGPARPGRPLTPRARLAATALAALLDGPATGPGSRRRHLLREAYLWFHLGSRWSATQTFPAAELPSLLAAHNLPARALLTALDRHAPALAGVAFFAWLRQQLGAAARPARPAGFHPAARPPAPHYLPPNPPQLARHSLVFSPAWLRPLARAFEPSTCRPALPTTIADAREVLLAYLAGRPTLATSPAAWRGLLRGLARQRAGSLRQLLQGRPADPLTQWVRLAAITDFSLLATLVGPAAQAARAAPTHRLDGWVAAAGFSPRVALFLRAAYLVFHGRLTPGNQAAVTQRLAATFSLPWRATLARVGRQGAAPGEPFTAWLRHLAGLAADGGGQPAPIRKLLSPPLRATPLPVAEVSARALAALSPAVAVTPARPALLPPGEGVTSLRVAQPPFTTSLSVNATLTGFNLLTHYLTHQHAPWWLPVPLDAAELADTLHAAFRTQPAALRQFVAQQAREQPVMQRLAALVGFHPLHKLLPTTRLGRRRRQLLAPALAALDARPVPGAGEPGPAAVLTGRLLLVLRQTWFTHAVGAAAPADALGQLRRQVAASGLSWRGALRQLEQALRRYPGLAADPFFERLLTATLPLAGRRWPRRLATATHSPANTWLPTVPDEANWQVVEHYLRTGQLPVATNLATALTQLLRAGGAKLLRARLHPYLDSAASTRLTAELPAALLSQLLRGVEPAAGRVLAGIAGDWLRLRTHNLVGAGTTPAAVWATALAVAGAPSPVRAKPGLLAQRLLQTEAPPPLQALAVQRLLAGSGQLPARLRSALAPLLATHLPAPPASPLARQGNRTLYQPLLPPAPAAPAEPTYLANAGLVVLGPFLPLLFDRLGYMQERRFASPAQAERAVHLLHFLAVGQQNPPEHLLVINKLLCGLPLAHPVARELALTSEEQATSLDLLRNVLNQWSALGRTSIAGLRETFLQRAGKLELTAERAALTLQTQTVDVLLDRLPWSISLIRLPWAALPLHVSWR